jgi:hypothetical protein
MAPTTNQSDRRDRDVMKHSRPYGRAQLILCTFRCLECAQLIYIELCTFLTVVYCHILVPVPSCHYGCKKYEIDSTMFTDRTESICHGMNSKRKVIYPVVKNLWVCATWQFLKKVEISTQGAQLAEYLECAQTKLPLLCASDI